MMPSAAITGVCGMGSTRSAQIRAMPTAHAQLVVLLEHEDGVVGLLGRRESRAGGEPDRESRHGRADEDSGAHHSLLALAWQRAGGQDRSIMTTWVSF